MSHAAPSEGGPEKKKKAHVAPSGEQFMEEGDGVFWEKVKQSTKKTYEYLKNPEKKGAREKIDKATNWIARLLDNISLLKFTTKEIDLQKAWEDMGRIKHLMSIVLRLSKLPLKFFVRGGGAVARFATGLLALPKYLIQGLSTIPKNFWRGAWEIPSSEMSYKDRYKGIFKSVIKLVKDPFVTPAKSFIKNRDELGRLMSGAKNFVEAATKGAYKNIKDTIKGTKQKGDKGEEGHASGAEVSVEENQAELDALLEQSSSYQAGPVLEENAEEKAEKELKEPEIGEPEKKKEEHKEAAHAPAHAAPTEGAEAAHGGHGAHPSA